MKKILYGVMAATMIFATSCENELEVGAAGEESVVSFTIATPDMGSRAYSDGSTATVLQYAVYDAAGNELEDLTVTDDDNVEIHGSTTVNLKLTTGNTYSVVFWAAAPNAPYTVDFGAKTMTVNYTNAVSNDESRDAFYAKETFTVTGAQTETITLKRPFAQLNIGTNDYVASTSAGYTPTHSAVTVKKLKNTLNFFDGTVTGDDKARVFASATIPAGQEFPVAGYEYLAMNYVLVGADKEIVDVEFTYAAGSDAKTRTVGSVPVQRNYRTNIYGQLLTSDVDINVEIKPGFDGEENISVWDGKAVEVPVADAEGVIRITTAAEFVGLMEKTGNSIYLNQTILLEKDIDLGGYTVKGIGGDSNFAGTFDGQGNTVSNFQIDATNRNYYAGLFNQVSHGGTIKNLTVANATIKGNSMVGAVASSLDSDAEISNCKAINCTLIGVKKVGSVVGYTAGSTAKNCYAENCVLVYSEKEAGEVVGFVNSGSTVSGNTYKDITFKPSGAALARELTPDANGVIEITRDYTVVGDWTSLELKGNTTTINGNGHCIKNLNQPFIKGNAGKNVTVNELTIAESNIGIGYENGLATGAFISYMDYSGSVNFNDCHLVKSTVTGKERAAALLGYGSNTTITINNCSVEECDIVAVGGAAGFVAYFTGSANISDSKVENSSFEATEDRTGKLALAGSVIGTVNGPATITNVTTSGNTVTNHGATGASEMFGRVLNTINGQTYVANTTDLANAIAKGGDIVLTADINVDKINLTTGTNDVVIDAQGHIITTNNAYGVEVSAGKNVTLKNAVVKMTVEGNYITYAAGFKISNGDYAGKTITLDNCTIKMINPDWAYAINMPASVKNLNLEINKCTLEGAIALQCWGDNNVINVTESNLICNYTTSEYYTSYCVALQGDGSYNSENNELNISDSHLSYSGIDNFTSNIYSVYDAGTNNTISVSNCTYDGVVNGVTKK